MSVDRGEIFPGALCSLTAQGCLSPWARWCRNCNCVFCGAHIDSHPCKPEDQEARKKLYVEEPPCPPTP